MTNSFHTKYIGKTHHYFEIIDSTNKYAQILTSNSSPKEGTVISAGFQSAGKGQYGRIWYGMAESNVYMSIILNPNFIKIQQQFLLNKAITIGIARAIEHLLKRAVKIKWPNDLYIKNGKIGGILIQNAVQGSSILNSVIGVGINVNQVDFENIPNPTSMKLENAEEFNLSTVRSAVFFYVEEWYELLRAGSFSTIENVYNEHLYGKGNPSYFRKDKQIIKGSIVSVDDVGRIIIDHHGSVSAYYHNEISLIIDKDYQFK